MHFCSLRKVTCESRSAPFQVAGRTDIPRHERREIPDKSGEKRRAQSAAAEMLTRCTDWIFDIDSISLLGSGAPSATNPWATF
jgi:hypothetical protein